MSVAEQVTAPVAYHGEGPCWSPAWDGLRFVDMLAGDLLTLHPDGRLDRLAVGSPVAAFVRPRAAGGYVVGTERGLALADEVDARPVPTVTLWEDPGVRMNEGTATPDGGLLAGSMAYDAGAGRGRLYRVGSDHRAQVVLEHVTISNGVGFSPDGTRAYYNDTPTGRTDVLDVVDGQLRRRRPFVHHDVGAPDGLCVDSAGNVWVALHGAGRVRCLSPAGEVVDEVRVPVQQVTACALGGADLRELFITTSREDRGLDAEPAAGALFRVRVATSGMPTLPYRG